MPSFISGTAETGVGAWTTIPGGSCFCLEFALLTEFRLDPVFEGGGDLYLGDMGETFDGSSVMLPVVVDRDARGSFDKESEVTEGCN